MKKLEYEIVETDSKWYLPVIFRVDGSDGQAVIVEVAPNVYVRRVFAEAWAHERLAQLELVSQKINGHFP